MNDIQNCTIQNLTDFDGNPIGGRAEGVGLKIDWQDGPLGRGADRKAPNGAFVETVIDVCKKRIEFYQTAAGGKFACQENADAIAALTMALDALEKRTKEREDRGVEGTHEK